MQIRYYTWVIRNWLWLVLLGTAFCSSITFGISKYIVQPVYEASVLIEVNSSLTSSTTLANDSITTLQNLAVSDSLLITSTSVLQAASQKLHGMSPSQIGQAVTASPQSGTQIIEVQARANNPQLAADIANAVASVFIQQQVGMVMTALQNQDTKLSQDLLSTKSNIDQTQAQINALQKSHASADQISSQKTLLDNYEAAYSNLLTNDNQVKLQESRVNNALSIQQPATPSEQPSSPRVLLNTVIAALLSLLLMIALALLLDWLDTSIRTPEDISRRTSLAPLGSIPLTKHPLLLEKLMDPTITNDDAVEQVFTFMSIRFSELKGAILVSGLQSGAGTTTTATNLAISFAQLGKRVLLVDANLRRPSLHEIYHIPNNNGLVNSLPNVHQFNETVIPSWLNLWRTNTPNLWLLPIGTHPPHFQMIQGLRELRTLINWLLQRNENILDYKRPSFVDIIILDASTLSEGTDALALASVADYSLVVVRAGKEQDEIVRKAGRTLQQLGSRVLGIVVNRQETRHRPHYYDDSLSRNALSIDGSSNDADGPLLTKQISSPHTPPSLLSIGRGDDLRGQSAPESNRAVPHTPNMFFPSETINQAHSNFNQFK